MAREALLWLRWYIGEQWQGINVAKGMLWRVGMLYTNGNFYFPPSQQSFSGSVCDIYLILVIQPG